MEPIVVAVIAAIGGAVSGLVVSVVKPVSENWLDKQQQRRSLRRDSLDRLSDAMISRGAPAGAIWVDAATVDDPALQSLSAVTSRGRTRIARHKGDIARRVASCDQAIQVGRPGRPGPTGRVHGIEGPGPEPGLEPLCVSGAARWLPRTRRRQLRARVFPRKSGSRLGPSPIAFGREPPFPWRVIRRVRSRRKRRSVASQPQAVHRQRSRQK